MMNVPVPRGTARWAFVVHAACKQSSRTPDASSSHLLRAFRDAKFVLINQLSFSDITHITT